MKKLIDRQIGKKSLLKFQVLITDRMNCRNSKSKNKQRKKNIKTPISSKRNSVDFYSSYKVVSKKKRDSEQKDLIDLNQSTLPIREIKGSCEKNYKRQYESVAGFLDDYDKILDKRIKKLEEKWSSVQILQKNLVQAPSNSEFQQPTKMDSLLEIQNNFYIQKITELQKSLKEKQLELRETKKALLLHQTQQSNSQLLEENRWLKEEKNLITRQNQVLKRKLKEAGIL